MFKDLGIKGRVLLLTLLPTSLLALVLGGYFTWMQLAELRSQLHERGELMVQHLAPLAAHEIVESLFGGLPLPPARLLDDVV